MSNGAGAKRQRKKEARRAKIEEEIRLYKARRRKRLMVNLSILAVVVGGIGFMVFQAQNPDDKAEPDASATKDACKNDEPKKGNTDTGTNPPEMSIDKAKTYVAVVETSCGTLEIELDDETSPNTVNSFVALAKQGFYNGLKFHRIVEDFAIQGGDPKGDGTGGTNYKTVDPPPAEFKYVKGVVAMAKAGNEPAGTAGSQFFIVPGEGAGTLPAEYAVLGKVVSGEETVAKLNGVETTDAGRGEKSSPTKPVFIVKITIRES